MAKYTSYFKPKIYCNINQKLAGKFTLHSAEAHLEPFQTSKQGGYLFGGNYFRKSSILDVWQGSEYAIARWTIKTIKSHKAKTHNVATLRQCT